MRGVLHVVITLVKYAGLIPIRMFVTQDSRVENTSLGEKSVWLGKPPQRTTNNICYKKQIVLFIVNSQINNIKNQR